MGRKSLALPPGSPRRPAAPHTRAALRSSCTAHPPTTRSHSHPEFARPRLHTNHILQLRTPAVLKASVPHSPSTPSTARAPQSEHQQGAAASWPAAPLLVARRSASACCQWRCVLSKLYLRQQHGSRKMKNPSRGAETRGRNRRAGALVSTGVALRATRRPPAALYTYGAAGTARHSSPRAQQREQATRSRSREDPALEYRRLTRFFHQITTCRTSATLRQARVAVPFRLTTLLIYKYRYR